MKPDNTRRGTLSANIASVLLLLVLPLWYTPLTQSLILQKNTVLALGLCFASLSIGRHSALVLALGAALSIAFPGGTAVILPVFALPALVSFFRRHQRERLVYFSAGLVSLLALLQWLGVDLFTGSTQSFSLPYAALTATLGNPNYLSLFLLFSAALFYAEHPENREQGVEGRSMLRPNGKDKDKGATFMAPYSAAVLFLGVAVVLLARSFLGWLLLIALVTLIAARQRRYSLLGVGALAGALGLFAYREAFLRAIEGRLYLTQVYISEMSSAVWLQGVGPGREASAFLHWQAAFLQEHPNKIRLWSYPEYAHNDLLSLSSTWGVVAILIGVGAALYFNRLRRPLLLSIGSLSLVMLAALGATVLYIAPVLVLAAALIAQATEPKTEPKPLRWVALPAALVLLGMSSLQAYSDHLSMSATKAAMHRDFDRAKELLTSAQQLPFQEAELLFLQARIFTEEGNFVAAKKVLQSARELLPHQDVFRLLAFACVQTKDDALLQDVVAQWRLYAPNDTLLNKFSRQ